MIINKKNNHLKVLFITSWYPNKENPIEGTFVYEHAKSVSLYSDIVVLFPKKSNYINSKKKWQIVSDNYEDGIRTLRVNYRVSSIPKTSYLLYLWSIGQALKKLLNENWKPDIIHAHIYSAGVPAIILGRIYKIPVVITEHFSAFPLRKLRRFEIAKARFALNRADLLLPVSRNLEEAIRSYKIDNRFKIIPNVVNTNIFYPKENRLPNKTKNILLVALLTPVKGINYLLNAIAELKKNRQDFILDIVGDGPYRKKYENFARKNKIEKLIKFHGAKTKKEISEIMRLSDFFVLPSLWENLPCVLIEAIASGLPIIASNVGGIPEIITKEIGILVPSKDSSSLANAINFMLDNYTNYPKDKISKVAKDKFSYEAVGSKLNKIYEGLCGHDTRK